MPNSHHKNINNMKGQDIMFPSNSLILMNPSIQIFLKKIINFIKGFKFKEDKENSLMKLKKITRKYKININEVMKTFRI